MINPNQNFDLAANNKYADDLITSKLLAEDQIDFSKVFRMFWARRWLIAIITFVSIVTSILYAISLPNQYKATSILIPATTSNASMLSKLAGQFGGLASLAGVNLGVDAEGDKTAVALELIKTWGFIESFIKNNDIEVEVYAAEGWSQKENKLIIDDELYDLEAKKWVRDFNPDKGETASPSSWELFESFKDRISIVQSKKSPVISISVEFYSPYLAKEWVDKLVRAINDYIRVQEKEDAQKSLDYLKKQIQDTELAEMKTVFFQLVEEQTKNLMLTEINDEYVFKTLSQSKIEEEKSKPNRALICIIGSFLGLCLGFFCAAIEYFFRHKGIS